MSQADMQLVRDHVPGGFNLAVGEPFFLHETYGAFYPRWFEGKPTYPQLNGDPELVKLLRERFGGQHVVVTNGAKQALLAALAALRTQGVVGVHHPAPYWPTYPTMAKLSSMTFDTEDPYKFSAKPGSIARVITAPNNPDGSEAWDSHEYDIWDAAYAHPIYGWDCLVPRHKISVWSAAKLYGPSGYRIGWLATADEKLAQAAATYVEQTTSGVATPSQTFLKNLLFNLDSLSQEEKFRLMSKARRMLEETSEAFMELKPYFAEVRGFPATGKGMFAWVRAWNPAYFEKVLAQAKVKVVNGKFCGGDDDWYRVSLGVTPDTMREAVRAIKEASNGSPQ